MKNTLLLLFIFVSGLVNAAPYHGQVKPFKQPDGSRVDLKLFGTEYYMRAEGLDGYTLIRDTKTKWICYARLSKDGTELISTGEIYKGVEGDPATLKSDLKMSLHLDISSDSRNRIINENKHKLEGNEEKAKGGIGSNSITGTQIHPVSGHIKGLCIVIDFSDEPAVVPFSEFEGFCNDLTYTGYGNNGSLRKYYSDISGGLMDYENVVYGYYRAPLTFAQYDAMPYAQGARQILGLALNWIKQQGFDFSTLSLNSDNSIMAINMMYTGDPPTWAEGMWHHAGSYTNFNANGVHSGRYNCSPANSPLEFGVVAHENGHMIGKWPDTYKYETTTGPDGIGSFDLMCSYGNPKNPPPPNPLFRANAGWGKVIDITNFNGVISDTSNDGVMYKYRNLADTNEFFLLESRLKTGRSTSIPSDGLTIWHMDRNGDNQTTHHEVYLVHAGNSITTHSTACFRSGFKTEYSATTLPNSNFYNTDPSGLRVWSIGPKGSVMTYKIGAGETAAFLYLNYAGLSDDNNTNGFAEAGESFNLNINTLNLGQIASSTTTKATCKVTSGASFATVNTDTVIIGAIQVNQSLPTAFNLSLQPNTPVGTEISVRFTVFDGPNSIFLNRKILVGKQLLMSSDSVNACSALFLDEGGMDSNYHNTTDLLKTLFPAQSGSKISVNFSAFNVPSDAICGTDYLDIYDGPTASYPYIGTYCGTTSPGTITATDTSGALTFYFHSDDENTGTGWKAVVSCLTPLEVAGIKTTEGIRLYPNPTKGNLTIRMEVGEAGTISLTDVHGKEVLNRSITGLEPIIVNLSANPEGIYFLRHQTKGGIWVKKVEVRR